MTDVGQPPSPGSATFTSPTFTVTSKGYDVNGAADQFTFAYRSVSGNVTIIGRLNTLANSDPWAQAGLMIRDGAGSNSRHAFVFHTPGNGLAMRSRKSKNSGTSQTSGGAGVAPGWLKLERRSSTLTAYRSSDGSSWTVIRSVNVQMSSTLLVGLAVASHSTATATTARFDSISINGQSLGTITPNVPPAVSLTTPVSGAAFTAPATIAMAATATDSDGTVAKVDFYNGSTLLGSDATSPYTYTWSGVATGSYSVKAIATDNAGATATSATASITVGSSATNVAPTVSMTSPASGASFVAGATVTFAANASDSDGTIQKVEFYLGSLLIATDTTSPYSATWPAALGSFSVNAVATDDKGARTSSAWRDFVVTAAPLVSKAIFKPASPTDAADYYVLEIFASGADPNTAAPVATQNLGLPAVVNGECSADVRATIVGLAAGNYIATVASMGSAGKLRSNSFSFTR